MIFLLSPSKTFSNTQERPQTIPHFIHKSQKLWNELSSLSLEMLQSIFDLSPALSKTVFNYYHHHGEMTAAIETYQGIAYKALDIKSIPSDLYSDRLYILSALYGILKPTDGILKYRLDFQGTHLGSLYDYWRTDINDYLKKEIKNGPIVSLCSAEYEHLLTVPYIHVSFYQNNTKAKSVLAKKLRGLFVRIALLNRLQTVDDLKRISILNFTYDEARSTSHILVFTEGDL